MSVHEAMRDLLAAVALGAATEQEAADVERHAATCHDCRAELDALRGAATGLALDVPQVAPPAALKGRVMDAVRAQGRVAPAPLPIRRRFAAWPALAAGLAVLAAGLLTWNLTLQGDRSTRSEIAFTSATDADVSGRVVIDEDGAAVMRITGLPALSADQGYELWTIRDGTPRSEGFAARTEDGEVVVATADLAGATALAVTPEKRSNVTAPTRTPIVTVALPASG